MLTGSSNPCPVSVRDKLTSKCQLTPRPFSFPELQHPHLQRQQSLPAVQWRVNETAEAHTVLLKTPSSALFSKMLEAHIDARTLLSGEGTEGKEGTRVLIHTARTLNLTELTTEFRDLEKGFCRGLGDPRDRG